MVEILEKDQSMPPSDSNPDYKPKFAESFGCVFIVFDKKKNALDWLRG